MSLQTERPEPEPPCTQILSRLSCHRQLPRLSPASLASPYLSIPLLSPTSLVSADSLLFPVCPRTRHVIGVPFPTCPRETAMLYGLQHDKTHVTRPHRIPWSLLGKKQEGVPLFCYAPIRPMTVRLSFHSWATLEWVPHHGLSISTWSVWSADTEDCRKETPAFNTLRSLLNRQALTGLTGWSRI